jgi:hypothetical protein
VLGNLISDVYPYMDSSLAAAELVRRLQAIADDVEAPSIVTIVVDGSVPWDLYEDGGQPFLVKTFEEISRSENLMMTTPSSFLEGFAGDPEILPLVWPGSLKSFSLDSWVGEEEEAAAWNLLWLVRQDLRLLSREGRIPDAEIFEAFDAMSLAESGDWFRWFGSDADTGNDRKMDELFRESLGLVYDRLDEPRTGALAVPLLPERSERRADGGWRTPEGALDIEWTEDGPELEVELLGTSSGFSVWVSSGTAEPRSISDAGSVLGMTARGSYRWSATSPGSVEVGATGFDRSSEPALPAELIERTVTFAIPAAHLGLWEVGEPLRFRVEYTDARGNPQGLIPRSGPAQIMAGVSTLLDIPDPSGDDHGPGEYTYPGDNRFTPGALDITNFE